MELPSVVPTAVWKKSKYIFKTKQFIGEIKDKLDIIFS